MFYEWLPNYEPKDFYIYKNILLSYPAADLEIIRQDWQTIVEKIRNGKAHEISEGDTNYLGASVLIAISCSSQNHTSTTSRAF